MAKKQRGPKASYLIYGGKPVQVIVEGRVVGISWDKGSRSYYTMLPDAETGRTKKKNLGRDKDKAVIKFKKITDAFTQKEVYHDILSSETRNAKTMFVQQSKNQTTKDFNDKLEELKAALPKQDDETLEEWKKRVYNNPALPTIDLTNIPEDWLLEQFNRMLENPQELAKKLGREEIARLPQLQAKEAILLTELIENYTNKKQKPLEKKQAKEHLKRWEQFCEITNKKYIDDIRKADIRKFQDTLYEICNLKGYSPSWIKHRFDTVKVVLKHNRKEYERTAEIDRVHNLCSAFIYPDKEVFQPEPIERAHFHSLFSAANLRWKAILLFSLNTAAYLKDVADCQIKDVDFKNKTLSMIRQKKRVPKIMVLWDETIEALQDYLATRKGSNPALFISQNGTPYAVVSMRNYFRKTLRIDAKVPATVKFNHLRDGAVLAAERAKCKENEIRYMLGHRNSGDKDAYLLRHPDLMVDVSKAIYDYYFSEKNIK